MSTKRDDRRAALAAAVAEHLLARGLGESGVRALARAAGTSDRMLLYYFGSKEAVLAAAFECIAAGLGAALAAALPPGRQGRRGLLDGLLTAGRDPALRPAFSLWFEIIGRAVRGEAPYRESARTIAAGFETFIAERLPPDQRARASEVFAELEGRLLLDLLR